MLTVVFHSTGYAKTLLSLSDSSTIVSTFPVEDTLHTTTDTTKKQEKKPDGALDTKVDYSAEDSMQFNLKEQKVYLFGSAEVNYGSINLKAEYIEIDLKTKQLFAIGKKDSLNQWVGKPKFSDAGQSFVSETMHYNFQTKKGKITEAITQEGEGFIHGKNVKKLNDDELFVKDGKYTTCNHEHPHFYIEAKKLKIIQNNKIITGPAYLVIEDVPTPLAVPFGMFPNKKERTAGILLPAYGESPRLGFFFLDGGYYLPLGQYADIELRGDIYSRGSWGTNVISRYKKRYKFDGGLDVSYSKFKRGNEEFPDYSEEENFFIIWRHTQDSKSRPNSNFSANVNAGTSSNFRNNYNANTTDYLTNTFKSSISYYHKFGNTPYNLNINANHSQNNIDTTVNITLPDISFTRSRWLPLKRKTKVGQEKFYEQLGITPGIYAKNQITKIKEYDLFKPSTLKQMKNGAKLSLPASLPVKVFKYASSNTNANLIVRLQPQTINKWWNNDSTRLETDTVQRLKYNYEWSLSTALNTKIYGMYEFKKRSPVQAIRHVITPSIGLSYTPDFADEKYGYWKYVQTNKEKDSLRYTIFQGGVYGIPIEGEQGLITFSLNNNIEMKVKSRSDTITGTKKVYILESFNISSSYNMLADTNEWAIININAVTRLFRNLNVRVTGMVDPYVVDSIGFRTRVSQWEVNHRIGRLKSATITFSLSLHSKNSENTTALSDNNTSSPLRQSNYLNFNPWSLNFNYNINYQNGKGEDSIMTQSLSIQGLFQLSQNWKIDFSSGYDFIRQEFTYSNVGIQRDLHCWVLIFNWVPFGYRQSYNLEVHVKSSVLRDLKLNRKRDWYDYE